MEEAHRHSDHLTVLEPPHRKVYLQALDLLTRRSYTRAELTHKLTRQGAAVETVTLVIDRCAELGYLNDDLLGEDLVLRLFRRGFGPARMRQDLKRKRFSPSEIDRLMHRVDAASKEPAAAREALRKKAAALEKVGDRRKRRDKAYRFLLGRGFSASTVRSAVAAFMDGELAWDREDPIA